MQKYGWYDSDSSDGSVDYSVYLSESDNGGDAQ